MKFENEPGIERGPLTALDRARVLSQALADAARLARVSKRSRRLLTGGGFQARRGAKALRLAILISFVVMVVVPSLGSAVYFGLIASDQYVAEAQFTVSGGAPIVADSVGASTGIPLMEIAQDTQIIVNYLHSRAAVEKLDAMIGLRKLYSDPRADSWARFNSKKPIEKFIRYWEHMSDVSIRMPGGIVELRVRAFRPIDAVTITSAVLRISEALINDMNDRMNHDAVRNAQREVKLTFTRLTDAQIALQTARNDMGLLNASKVADSLNTLITNTRSALLQLQQEYETNLKYMRATAPQMRALKNRIDATSVQIADLESKLTHTKLSASGESTLAASMTKFDELDLERQVAQGLYTAAVSSLEVARIIAEHQMMYINTFVKPALPQEAEYPRRLLMTFAISAGALTLWGACCGIAVGIRNYKA